MLASEDYLANILSLIHPLSDSLNVITSKNHKYRVLFDGLYNHICCSLRGSLPHPLDVIHMLHRLLELLDRHTFLAVKHHVITHPDGKLHVKLPSFLQTPVGPTLRGRLGESGLQVGQFGERPNGRSVS